MLVSTSAAQGLGDTAARERAKRAQTKKPDAKVFNNDDLAAGRPPGQKKEDAAAQAQPQAASEPETLQPARDDSRSEVNAYVDALRAAEGEVKAVEGRVQDLSARLNPMSLTYIYGAGGSNDANEELRVRAELRQAEEQLAAARQAVATANRNLQDVRSGRPVGSDEPR